MKYLALLAGCLYMVTATKNLFLAVPTSKIVTITPKNGTVHFTKKYEQIVEGILKGALEIEDIGDAESCIKDGQEINDLAG